ncbi:MAG: hypothetical protein OXI71_00805 [Gemmatimonadota bacterium]|nr:hypothetical protein [Gemmatimonadota bacterium]
MKAWTLTAAALAVTLTLAGCAEDGPGSMAEAEPETFDAATVYEIVPVGEKPTQPGDADWPYAYFLQFDSEKAKARFADLMAQPPNKGGYQLAALSAELTAQAWNDKRTVHVVGDAPAGGWGTLIHSYNWDPPDLKTLYGPDRQRRPLYGTDRNRREEVRR